ncbi:hypothetical protein DACRYDRAFT_111485 [Dacryopinax primogenitus]|uniref:Uncharacterized protein n=1 Tax=Dacryopinax primogenitus (strain DJM 731) TaxID=1858805 RepID=M5FQV4_DACPD|nr:uncharacterized protein DACRYDRAFT_111485 [Dacryopinax primogenitus]EJT97968.1 hypothetical protein DACRYDRAFT_111485 [Dacryopinax primogenitus]
MMGVAVWAVSGYRVEWPVWNAWLPSLGIEENNRYDQLNKIDSYLWKERHKGGEQVKRMWWNLEFIWPTHQNVAINWNVSVDAVLLEIGRRRLTADFSNLNLHQAEQDGQTAHSRFDHVQVPETEKGKEFRVWLQELGLANIEWVTEIMLR